MGARRNPKRRAEMLAAFAGYLLRSGMADLSLRPAAAALGTNPRMLLYYFGSKEKLLLEGIRAIRSQERARLAREMQRRRLGGSIAEVVWVIWRWYTAKHREPYLRLFYELYGLAVAAPRRFKHFLDVVGEDYPAVMEEGLRSWGLSAPERRLYATVYMATFRGLILDLLSTGVGLGWMHRCSFWRRKSTGSWWRVDQASAAVIRCRRPSSDSTRPTSTRGPLSAWPG